MAGLKKRMFENSRHRPSLWLRGLNGICIWTESLEKLQEFFQFLSAFRLLWTNPIKP